MKMTEENKIYPTEFSPVKKAGQVVCLLEKGEFFNAITELLSNAGYKSYTQSALARHLTYEADGIYFANMRKAEGIERLSLGNVDCAILTGAKALDLILAKKVEWKARHPFETWNDSKADIMVYRQYKLTGGRFCFMALPEIADKPKDIWRYAIRAVSSPYPTIAQQELVRMKIKANVIFSSGSTEVDPLIGAADAVFDEVIGGETARQNGLRVFKTYASSLTYGNIPLIFAVKRSSLYDLNKKSIIKEMAERLDSAYERIINGEVILDVDRNNDRGKVPMNYNDNITPQQALKDILSKTAEIEEPLPETERTL